MSTKKIEEYLIKLEEIYGVDNLLAILNGEKIDYGKMDSADLIRTRLKTLIQEHLPSNPRASVKKMAKYSYILTIEMDDKIEDAEISAAFQEFIKVASREHLLAGFSFFFDELTMESN